jgi:hypothetical protein
VKRAAAASALLAAIACARSHGTAGIPPGSGPLVGIYRATIGAVGAPVRHARVLLWAKQPDRLHAELLGPVGGVRLVLDAGAGSACVVDPGAQAAYAGDAGASLERIVGVRLSIADLVEALLTGTAPAAARVQRSETAAGSLPDRFTITDAGGALDLTLLRFERSTMPEGRLGTGVPPQTMTVHPLDELPLPPPEPGEDARSR